MKRRAFLQSLATAPILAALSAAWAGSAPRSLLILVELKGGNDGLNTVVPYADTQYAKLRPRIAIARDQVLQLSESTGLHPSLASLLPPWKAGELAIVQGVGYPDPNLSHFRSIEIWDTASRSDEYLDEGWLTRAFARFPSPAGFAADGVVVGGADLGPLAGAGARTIALTSPEQFLRSARLARGEGGATRNAALAHILKVERDILASAERLNPGRDLRTEFPSGPFGNAVKSAAQLAANPSGVSVIRLTLGSFDTHANQAAPHAALLKQLGDGLAALRDALVELGRWQGSVIATYSEFGRRPYENQSGGTDHGTASAHFVMGGAVHGGVFGAAPRLDRLDGSGNLPFAVDFRSYYATLIEQAWGIGSRDILGQQFEPLRLFRTS